MEMTAPIRTHLAIPLNLRFFPCPRTHESYNLVFRIPLTQHRTSSSSRRDKSAEETNYIADAIASIRLAVSHHDPYEEWSNQTRREARVRSFTFVAKARLRH